MTNILLAVIILFEIIRLIVYLRDSKAVKETNKKVAVWQSEALAKSEKHDAEWKELRKAELVELRELAKTSDTMKEIYDEWVESHKAEDK